MTQKAAVNFCENELQVRAHLLEVDTVEENAAIQAEILRRPANVWLGITNPWIKDQGPWSLVLILDSGPWSWPDQVSLTRIQRATGNFSPTEKVSSSPTGEPTSQAMTIQMNTAPIWDVAVTYIVDVVVIGMI